MPLVYRDYLISRLSLWTAHTIPLLGLSVPNVEVTFLPLLKGFRYDLLLTVFGFLILELLFSFARFF